MIWGLALSVITIGASLVTKKDDRVTTKIIPSSSSLSHENRIFLAGTVLGLGCSLLYSCVMSKYRITENIRMLWLYWTNTDGTKDLWPYRSPKPALDSEDYIYDSKDGSILLLLSPDTAATKRLHVSLICIKPDCEIPSRIANSVEFYYVISGNNGRFSQKGVHLETINAGDCFVVDAGNMRWINNPRENKNDLLLLRATDGGNIYSSTKYIDQKIQQDSNHRTTSLLDNMSESFRKVQERAKEYYNSSSNKHIKTNGTSS